MHIEPDAKIVQSHFCRQASLKAGYIMRPFPIQTKRVQQLVVDGLNDLPETCQPTAQGFGPTLFAPLMRWSNQIHLVVFLPLLSRSRPCKALIGHIRALSRLTSTRQAWRRRLASSKQGGS